VSRRLQAGQPGLPSLPGGSHALEVDAAHRRVHRARAGHLRDDHAVRQHLEGARRRAPRAPARGRRGGDDHQPERDEPAIRGGRVRRRAVPPRPPVHPRVHRPQRRSGDAEGERAPDPPRDRRGRRLRGPPAPDHAAGDVRPSDLLRARPVRQLGALLRLRVGGAVQPRLRRDRHGDPAGGARLRPPAGEAGLGRAERDLQSREPRRLRPFGREGRRPGDEPGRRARRSHLSHEVEPAPSRSRPDVSPGHVGTQRLCGLMSPRNIRACPALLALALAACAGGTKLVNSWKEPGTAPLELKQGDLVIAMVMSKEETTRRTGEDLLGEELRQRGLRPIPSFSLIPTDQVDDKEKAAAAIQDSGAVALISMRPIAVNKQQTFVPPSYTGPGGPYGGWGPYSGYGWGAPYSPGYVVTDTIVRIETLVFDLKQNKLVWAGQSETTNPDRTPPFMRELVKTVGDDMRRKGVIAAPAS